ncbi:hypothetical protein [Chelatococcus reniformis]|nr:hypothetical protein [Chelatococcus reniformis]
MTHNRWLAFYGAIRGEAISIEVAGPPLAPGEELVLVDRKPSGTREAAACIRRIEQIEPDGAERARHYFIEQPLADFAPPLFGIAVVARSSAAEVAVDAGPGYALANLFPTSEHDFISRYTWERQRIPDSETLVFACHQVIRYSDFPAARKIAAASIIAYRALEQFDLPKCEIALGLIDDALARVPELKPSRHLRNDRAHLAVSLNIIRWHLCLMLGRFDEVASTLETGFALLLPIENAASISYNGAKTLLFWGMVLWRRGDHVRAAEVFDFSFTFYQRAALSATIDNPTMFYDQRVAHRVAYLSAYAKRAIKGELSARDLEITPRVVGEEIFRVRNARAQARLKARLDEMMTALQR